MRPPVRFGPAAAAAAACALIAGCELALTHLPATESVLLMHGVLNGAAPSQAILLERTLSGEHFITYGKFEPGNPLVSSGGLAVPRASVRLVTETGDTLVALEDGLPSFNLGVYRFHTPGSALTPGAVHTLLVRTEQGEVLSAETRLPGAPAAPIAPPRSFDRLRDTVMVEWTPVPQTRSYAIRVDGPYGPFLLFTDSTRLRLTGELRNSGVSGAPRVFFPGFRQTVTVSAVDSNYYDYYRSRNAEATGTGIINRVRGGLGVLGALTPVFRQRFDVTQASGDPIEGTFDQVDSPAYFAASVILYLESPATASDQSDALSGRFVHTAGFSGALLGTRRGDSLRLRFLGNEVATDTLEFLRAAIRGDTFDAVFSRGATGRFVKRAPAP